ncbi:MAG: hypothetical protein AB7O43_05235 [Hyphomicrobiaceae bacterium]
MRTGLPATGKQAASVMTPCEDAARIVPFVRICNVRIVQLVRDLLATPHGSQTFTPFPAVRQMNMLWESVSLG